MSDLTKYIDYIRNTGRDPLPVEMFDEDWEPVGPMVRENLVRAGMIEETPHGIRIHPAST